MINGSSTSNQIAVMPSGLNAVATMDGAQLIFSLAAVRRVYVDGGAGDDVIATSLKRSATIIGSAGNDTLTGGMLDDSIDGGAGDDIINGEDGSDALTGGDGIDTADYGDRDTPFRFNFPTPDDAEPSLNGKIIITRVGEFDLLSDYFEVIGGTNQRDEFSPDTTGGVNPVTVTLLGRGGNDVFLATGGSADLIEIGGSEDDYFGGYYGGIPDTGGHTTILGGPGNDYFEVVGTPAYVDGGAGSDRFDLMQTSIRTFDLNTFQNVENVVNVNGQRVIGTAAPNVITMLASDLFGFAQSTTIFGNGGNDTIIGSTFADQIDGGDGNDSIDGGGGNDTLLGGLGNDMLIGNSGNDKLYGGAGNDTLLGGPGRDRMYGEAGDDLFAARDKKRDTLYGGNGADSAKLMDLYHEIEKLV